MSAQFTTAADAVAHWRDTLYSGERPIRWPLGNGFESVELGPGLVLLLGGAPGAGKTALAMQWVLDALRLDGSLRALVANVETAPAVLLDRQLARFSGVPLRTIRDRQLEESHASRIDFGLGILEAIGDRLAFLSPPFTMANLAAAADETGATLLVLDYVQRFAAGGDDKRGEVNRTMDYLRQFAGAGCGLLVLAAVSRGKDRKGNSSYAADGLGLASFRESSELEYGCDSAYMLTREVHASQCELRALKNRNGEPTDLQLMFDASVQRFAADTIEATGESGPPVLTAANDWLAQQGIDW